MPDVQENKIWANVLDALKNAGTGLGNFLYGPTHDEQGNPLNLDGTVEGGYFDDLPYETQQRMRGVGQQSSNPFDFLGSEEVAAGKSVFSTPAWDEKNKVRKYFENDQRLRDKGILPTPKAEIFSNFLDNFIAENTPRGDSQPIRPFPTKKGTSYMPIPFGPSEFPRA